MPATCFFRYDRTRPARTERATSVSDWEAMSVFERGFRQLVREPDGRHYQQALVNYIRALDGDLPNMQLVELWSVLELLTIGRLSDKGIGDLDQRLLRSVQLYRGPDVRRQYMRETLERIRMIRNAYVHGGRSDDQVIAAVRRLREHIVHLFHCARKHLGQHGGHARMMRVLDLMAAGESDVERLVSEHRLALAMLNRRTGR